VTSKLSAYHCTATYRRITQLVDSRIYWCLQWLSLHLVCGQIKVSRADAFVHGHIASRVLTARMYHCSQPSHITLKIVTARMYHCCQLSHITSKIVTARMYHCSQLSLQWCPTAIWGCYRDKLSLHGHQCHHYTKYLHTTHWLQAHGLTRCSCSCNHTLCAS